MMIEVCKEFGWTIDHVLAMPARRFFVIKKALIEHKRKEKLEYLHELCSVQAISFAGPEYYENLKQYYREQIDPDLVRKRVNSRLFDVNNKAEADAANEILSSIFEQKKRLMGLK